MSICRDLSFLNKKKFNDLDDSLRKEILDSCFPGIKNWLLTTLNNSNHRYLFYQSKKNIIYI